MHVFTIGLQYCRHRESIAGPSTAHVRGQGSRHCADTEPTSLHGDVHWASGTTQTFVNRQQTCWGPVQSVALAQLCFDGDRQCLASGQQYSSFLHTGLPIGGEQASAVLTHSLVIWEHTSPEAQSPADAQKLPGLVGERQCLRSESQYVPFPGRRFARRARYDTDLCQGAAGLA
jgi:hypothetical protein